MVHVLGIDPGIKGGLAFVSEAGQILATYPMPVKKKVLASGKVRSEVDEDRLAQIIREHKIGLLEAWIEDVRAIGGKKGKGQRGDGVVGAFSFGEGKGILKGVCAGCGVVRRFANPAVWKANMGVTADKKTAILKAQALFPDSAAYLTKDGPAEAALIALYGLLTRLKKAPCRWGEAGVVD